MTSPADRPPQGTVLVWLLSRTVTEAVCQLLSAEPGLRAVPFRGTDLVLAVAEVQPDALVLDDRVSDERLQLALPVAGQELPVVLLHDGPAAAPHVALAADRSTTGAELLSALRRLVVGEEPQVLKRRAGRSLGPHAGLTRREMDVLELLAAGHSPPSVAASLGVSPHTVRTHVQNLMGKLNAHSKVEAVATARREGLLGAPQRPAAER